MWGKFESRFKRRDESSVNAPHSRGRGKLALSTQTPQWRGFRHAAHVSLTVAIAFALTNPGAGIASPEPMQSAPDLS
jgi:hypothetical protein